MRNLVLHIDVKRDNYFLINLINKIAFQIYEIHFIIIIFYYQVKISINFCSKHS